MTAKTQHFVRVPQFENHWVSVLSNSQEVAQADRGLLCSLLFLKHQLWSPIHLHYMDSSIICLKKALCLSEESPINLGWHEGE